MVPAEQPVTVQILLLETSPQGRGRRTGALGNRTVGNATFRFCGHSASKIKGLVWEGDGFLMLYKRIESGRFSWPRTSSDLKNLSPEQSRWLMMGFSIEPVIQNINPFRSA
ncbi:MAG: IS66 family insertion sequence element accessory protein TnpB [Lachnospiraceae bacterium]|nr:IS66 family insertion sequence element accessory protein TnpB [Lachnospiraceae bacterium]